MKIKKRYKNIVIHHKSKEIKLSEHLTDEAQDLIKKAFPQFIDDEPIKLHKKLRKEPAGKL